MRVISILLIILILLGVGMATYNYKTEIKNFIMEEKKQLFQGPVPEGYDEQHFRETGETIPSED